MRAPGRAVAAPAAATLVRATGSPLRRLLRFSRARFERFVRWRWDCGFWIQDDRLTTRILLPNPQMGPGWTGGGAKLAVVTFHRPDGGVAARRAVRVPLGHTRVLDTSVVRGLPPFGQVRVDWFFRAGLARGGNRTVFQWYFAGGMTCVHEKREPTPARDRVAGRTLRPGQGYMTLFGVPEAAPLDLYLICTSQDWSPAAMRLRRFDGARPWTGAPVRVAPWGAALVDVRAAAAAAGGSPDGPLAIDAAQYALSYFYLLHNREDGSWQAQHL